MKKIAILPYSDYEKMKYKVENSHQQSLQQDQYPPVQSYEPVSNNQLHQQPKHTSHQIHQPLPLSLYNPKVDRMNKYEEELSRIINSDMDINEKQMLYQSVLQQLLHMKDLFQRSFVNTSDVQNPHSVDNNTHKEDNFKHILDQTLPVRTKKAGIALYNILKGQIVWDENGQIIIEDKTVYGSNIVDLISDLSRNWTKPPVAGWDEIKQELQTLNFPRTLIQNKQRLEDLNNILPSPRPDMGIEGSSFASGRAKRSRPTLAVSRLKHTSFPKLNWINS